jgi:hypothetical protein
VGLEPIADGILEVYFGPILLGTLHEKNPKMGFVKVAD